MVPRLQRRVIRRISFVSMAVLCWHQHGDGIVRGHRRWRPLQHLALARKREGLDHPDIFVASHLIATPRDLAPCPVRWNQPPRGTPHRLHHCSSRPAASAEFRRTSAQSGWHALAHLILMGPHVPDHIRRKYPGSGTLTTPFAFCWQAPRLLFPRPAI